MKPVQHVRGVRHMSRNEHASLLSRPVLHQREDMPRQATEQSELSCLWANRHHAGHGQAPAPGSRSRLPRQPRGKTFGLGCIRASAPCETQQFRTPGAAAGGHTWGAFGKQRRVYTSLFVRATHAHGRCYSSRDVRISAVDFEGNSNGLTLSSGQWRAPQLWPRVHIAAWRAARRAPAPAGNCAVTRTINKERRPAAYWEDLAQLHSTRL